MLYHSNLFSTPKHLEPKSMSYSGNTGCPTTTLRLSLRLEASRGPQHRGAARELGPERRQLARGHRKPKERSGGAGKRGGAAA